MKNYDREASDTFLYTFGQGKFTNFPFLIILKRKYFDADAPAVEHSSKTS